MRTTATNATNLPRETLNYVQFTSPITTKTCTYYQFLDRNKQAPFWTVDNISLSIGVHTSFQFFKFTVLTLRSTSKYWKGSLRTLENYMRWRLSLLQRFSNQKYVTAQETMKVSVAAYTMYLNYKYGHTYSHFRSGRNDKHAFKIFNEIVFRSFKTIYIYIYIIQMKCTIPHKTISICTNRLHMSFCSTLFWLETVFQLYISC